MRLRSLVLSLVIAVSGLLFQQSVFAQGMRPLTGAPAPTQANRCIVTCRSAGPAGEVRAYLSGDGACANSNPMTGTCQSFCRSQCGATDPACGIVATEANTPGMRCVAPVPTIDPTNPGVRGACSFQCADGQNFGIRQGCNADVECAESCHQECAQGAHLTCAQAPAPTCVPRPTATPGQTASTPAPSSGSSARLSNPLGTSDLRVIAGRIARALIGIIGAVALLMFVLGGILWMTAGDSKRVDQAKGILINSTIGIVLVFFAYFIAVAVLAFFGVS